MTDLSRAKKQFIQQNACKALKTLMASTALAAAGAVLMNINTALALPQGEQVVGGDVSYERTGDTLNAYQTTQQAYTLWQSFDTSANETVNIHTPNASALSVNKVIGGSTTQFHGALNSNANVWILNQNGVFFGATARIDVGGILASTGDVAVADVMDGDGRFEFSNFGDGTIVNFGTISVAEAGLAAFVAPFAANHGVINAKLGTVAFAAGKKVTLDMYGDGLYEIAVDGQLADALLENTGTIDATGGSVIMSADAAKEAVDDIINMDGIATVASATVKGGKIILSGGDSGTVSVSGTLDATGETGGEIEVTGQRVVADGEAEIDASGKNGGGAIRFGGAFQGGGDTPTSDFAFVGQSAILRTNAEDEGDGGEVVVWSDKATEFYGTIEAKGGANSGNGGLVEVSGKALTYQGKADTTAANGNTGWLLLDPLGIRVFDGPAGVITLAGDPVLSISDEDLNISLNLSNVLLATSPSQASYEDAGGPGLFPPVTGNSPNDDNITVEDGTAIDTGANTLYFSTTTLNLYSTITGNVSGGIGSPFTPAGITLKDPTTVNVFTGATTQASIRQGIDIAASGATVNVGAGTYAESININKSVTLLGANSGMAGYDPARGSESVIDPAINADAITITADNVTIDGFEITNPGNRYGVLVRADNATIKNNVIHDITNGFAGVRLENSDNATVSHNHFYDITGNGSGVHSIMTNNGLTVDSNVFDMTGGDAAVEIAGFGGSGLSVTANSFSGGSYGVSLHAGAGDIDVRNNVFNGNAIDGLVVKSTANYAVTVFENSFTGVYGGKALNNASAVTVDASGNWWGSTDENVIAANIGGAVDFTPFLTSGTDTSTATGFQGDFSQLYVTALGEQVQAGGRINEAIGLLDDGALAGGNRIIHVMAGTYAESVNVGKAVKLRGWQANFLPWTRNGIAESVVKPGTSGFYVTADNVTIDGFTIDGGTTGVLVDGNLNTIIKNNIVTGTAGDGIFVDSGTSTRISGNAVSGSLNHGIYVLNSDDVQVGDLDPADRNIIFLTGGDGIRIEGGAGGSVAGNMIGLTEGDGIHATGANSIDVISNKLALTFGRGVYVGGSTGTIHVNGNEIVLTGGHGIELNSIIGDVEAADNRLFMIGLDYTNLIPVLIGGLPDIIIPFNDADGIHVRNVTEACGFCGTHTLRIQRNAIIGTGGDGIDVGGSGTTLIQGNKNIEYAGLQQIEYSITTILNHLTGLNIGTILTNAANVIVGNGSLVDLAQTIVPVPDNIVYDGHDGIIIAGNGPTDIADNGIRRAGDDGIQVTANSDDVEIGKNIIQNADDNGIEISNSNNTFILFNDILNNGNRGVYGQGGNGSIVLSGNVFTDNPVHARLESGAIDLTQDSNLFNFGGTAIQISGSFTSLVGDTIGGQVFNGQSDYFVELENGALFDPGQPTVLGALDSTYVTPFGIVIPASTGGIIGADTLTFLEDMFWHHTDDNGLGLFFFGGVPVVNSVELDQEDIFNQFAQFGRFPGGVSFTLNGLPFVDPAQALAALSPAGGDNDGSASSAERLASIQPTAGGAEASCWADALAAAGTGASVNFSFGGGLDETLAAAAGCSGNF